MNRLEFEEQLIAYAGEDNMRVFTEEEYKKIEYVYTWHPAIKPVGGKRQIAIICQEFGMGMINDMTPQAHEMEALETKCRDLKHDLVDLENEMTAIYQRYE